MITRTIDLMCECGADVVIGASPASLADLADYRNWLDPLFKEYMILPGGCQPLTDQPRDEPLSISSGT